MPKEMPIEQPDDDGARRIVSRTEALWRKLTSYKAKAILNLVFVLMITFLGVGLVASCVSSIGGDSDGSSSAVVDGPKTVTYRISGSAQSASVTYSGSGGSTEQKSGAAVPNEVSFTAEPGEFLYVSAQNEGESGDIQVSIEVDGQTISSANSSGGYTIATASETCP